MSLNFEECKEVVEKRRHYNSTHEWVRTNFGKADRCEMDSCSGECKRFEWSLRKGYEYERKRENFWMLCSSCHVRYDRNPDTAEKISKTLTGRKLTKEHAQKIAKANTGSKRTLESRAKMSAKRKGKKLSESHRKKISEGLRKRKATHLAALEAIKQEDEG